MQDGAAHEKMAASAPSAGSLNLSAPSAGSLVLVHSLSARADLNGLVGTVSSEVDASTGRLAVRLPTSVTKAPVLLKPQNTTLVNSLDAELVDQVDPEHAAEVRERISTVQSGATKTLDLDSTGLRALPVSIAHLGGIGQLWLAGNAGMEPLPAAVVALQSLRVIDIDGCQLLALPDALGYLPTLRKLYANENRLARLPLSLSKLR